MKKGNGIVIFILGVLVAGISIFLVILNFRADDSSNDFFPTPQVTEKKEDSTEDFTSDPFYTLTIPYLRERSYESELTELDVLSNTGSYTSYLTSYDSDGFNINGLLTIPNRDEPEGGFPAIVFIHGYIPPSVYETTQNYVAYVDYLAKNGFVVFKIDLRGHADSEGIAEGSYYSSGYIIDTLNAVSALKSSDFVDGKRIGLWGHSMGGNVVFRSLVANSDTPVAVIWAGAVYTYEDFDEYRISDNSYRPPSDTSERRRDRERLADTHGNFDPEDEFWKMVVPTNYLDGITTALQLNHATDDNVVNIGYSRNLINVLEGSSLTYELNEYPSGGHNISGNSFNEAMQNTVEFFREHLE